MRPRGMLVRWWDRWRSRLVVPNTVPPPPIVYTRGHLERTVPPRIATRHREPFEDFEDVDEG